MNWLSKVQNYDSMNAKVLRESIKNKNFKYQFGDAKKFFDTKEMKKQLVPNLKILLLIKVLEKLLETKGLSL